MYDKNGQYKKKLNIYYFINTHLNLKTYHGPWTTFSDFRANFLFFKKALGF